ncbi:MAG: hypothetical protein KKF27_21750 [Gammaproteobacteria bacterium]|nr:hypothetical protein [Gammaproteobacteria bacterium]
MNNDANGVLDDIYIEYKKAENKFPAFNSGHEGWAVIKEELDELWEEVRNYPASDKRRMKKEAIQVGAMALRFIVDLCED